MKPVFIGKALIGHREAPRRRDGEPLPPGERLRLVRIDEVERIIRHRRDRHGVIPEDAALVALIDHGAAAGTIRYWRPDLDGPAVDAIVASATGRKWTAKALGQALDLDLGERVALDIRSIRAKGQTRADQRKAKREADRARIAAKRSEQGIKTRAEYLAEATSTKALAQRFGVSARTVRRWLAAGRMPSCPASVAHNLLGSMCDTGRTPAAPPPQATAPEGAARPSADPAPGTDLASGIRLAMARVRALGLSVKPVFDRYDATVHRLVTSLVITGQAGALTAPTDPASPRRGAP